MCTFPAVILPLTSPRVRCRNLSRGSGFNEIHLNRKKINGMVDSVDTMVTIEQKIC